MHHIGVLDPQGSAEPLGGSCHPVTHLPDKEELACTRLWLPELFQGFRTRCTWATLEGGTGEFLSRAYHVPGSLHVLSCTSPRRCLLLATLYKWGTGGERVSGISKCWNQHSNTGLNLKPFSVQSHFATELLKPPLVKNKLLSKS